MSNYSISQEEFERIESYLLGKMDSSEVLVFENEMRTNSEILEKVNDLRTRIDAIETVERKRKLDQFHDQLESICGILQTRCWFDYIYGRQ